MRLWRGCGEKGGCGKKKAPRGKKEGKFGERDGFFHNSFHSVEKEGKGFSQTVDNPKKVWYNFFMHREPPDFGELGRKIAENSAKFDAFYELLIEYNARFNLTAITEREEVFHKHFLDSAAGEGFFAPNARCAEVGSGAGFPSIPLKIIRGDLSLTLIESTEKKCEFLRTVVRELGLKDVEIVNARAEDLARDIRFRETFDVCFARAVARMNTLAEYCMPFVRVGGRFLAYKSDDEEELASAQNALALFGGERGECVRYELPGGYGARTLMFCKKTRPTPPKYPRGRGLERRAPIL